MNAQEISMDNLLKHITQQEIPKISLGRLLHNYLHLDVARQKTNLAKPELQEPPQFTECADAFPLLLILAATILEFEKKLAEIEDSPAYQAVWSQYSARGYIYTGENYGKEIAALRELLGRITL